MPFKLPKRADSSLGSEGRTALRRSIRPFVYKSWPSLEDSTLFWVVDAIAQARVVERVEGIGVSQQRSLGGAT